MPKVYIVGAPFFAHFKAMYEGRGYTLVDTLEEADIVQFTGGEDINPKLYGEETHRSVYFHKARDEYEIAAFNHAQDLGKLCAGVCRGGQLLNVLSGGSMYQDVRGHGGSYDGHPAMDVEDGSVFSVTSYHHQMMKLGEGGVLLAKSQKMLSRTKLGMTKLGNPRPEEVVTIDDDVEVEGCYYPSTRSLCYQPHPEFANDDSACRNWYFAKLEKYLEQ